MNLTFGSLDQGVLPMTPRVMERARKSNSTFKEEFPKIFEDTFKDKFLLLTHDEVMEKKLFGLGKDHEMFNDMIGDYVAIAVSNESILITHIEAERLIGGHAGLTKEEMEIPLIAVKR